MQKVEVVCSFWQPHLLLPYLGTSWDLCIDSSVWGLCPSPLQLSHSTAPPAQRCPARCQTADPTPHAHGAGLLSQKTFALLLLTPGPPAGEGGFRPGLTTSRPCAVCPCPAVGEASRKVKCELWCHTQGDLLLTAKYPLHKAVPVPGPLCALLLGQRDVYLPEQI